MSSASRAGTCRRPLARSVAALLLSGLACCCYSPAVARSPRVSRPLRAAARRPAPPVAGGEPEVRVRLTEPGSPVALTCNRAVTLSCGRDSRRLEAGTRLTLRPDRGITVEVGARPWQRTGETLYCRPVEEGLWSVGTRRYRGRMLAFRDSAGGIALVNELGLEDYLAGVVPAEIGPINDETIEAVKAQAVAARSFTLTRLGRRRGLGHSLFDSYLRDQEYRGAGAEVELARRALSETRGEVLLLGGEPLEALYHANCGGRTAPGAGGAIPSVHDTRDGRPGRAWCAGGKHYAWTASFTRDEFERRLAAVAGRGGRLRVRSLRIERDESGRARRLEFATDRGSVRVGGSDFRMGLGLKSTQFEVELGARTVKFTGRGWGHGVGMCQEGALAQARAGNDYRRILGRYYPGASVSRRY
ncbi:MAG: SpoIID/LytB domain-containing protein [bacterium]